MTFCVVSQAVLKGSQLRDERITTLKRLGLEQKNKSKSHEKKNLQIGFAKEMKSISRFFKSDVSRIASCLLHSEKFTTGPNLVNYKITKRYNTNNKLKFNF